MLGEFKKIKHPYRYDISLFFIRRENSVFSSQRRWPIHNILISLIFTFQTNIIRVYFVDKDNNNIFGNLV